MEVDATFDAGGDRRSIALRRACCPGSRRGSRRGLTLIEVLIVISVAMLLMGGMVFGAGQIQRSRLKGSSTRVAAAMRAAYQRSSSTGRQMRLVIDIDAGKIWLEESSDVMLLKKDDLGGAGGAAAATAAEKLAETEANRIAAGVQTARATFSAVSGPAGKPQDLYSGILVKSVDATHLTLPQTTGHGYIYFFGAEAERAAVQLSFKDGDPERDVFTVVLSPLTGKASVVDKAVVVPHPRDDAEASEAEDNGGF